MAKGEIKIKKGVSHEPRLSPDKRTFVLVIESTDPMSWYDAVLRCNFWSKDELRRLIGVDEADLTEH
jgi:hypothetical protein